MKIVCLSFLFIINKRCGVYTTTPKPSPHPGHSTLFSSVTLHISLFPSTCPSFVSIPSPFLHGLQVHRIHTHVCYDLFSVSPVHTQDTFSVRVKPLSSFKEGFRQFYVWSLLSVKWLLVPVNETWLWSTDVQLFRICLQTLNVLTKCLRKHKIEHKGTNLPLKLTSGSRQVKVSLHPSLGMLTGCCCDKIDATFWQKEGGHP